MTLTVPKGGLASGISYDVLRWNLRTSRVRLARPSFSCDCFRLNLHQHLRRNQLGYFHHARCGPDLTEELSVRPPYFFPSPRRMLVYVHTRADHVFHASSGLLQGGLNIRAVLAPLGRRHLQYPRMLPLESVAVVPET